MSFATSKLINIYIGILHNKITLHFNNLVKKLTATKCVWYLLGFEATQPRNFREMDLNKICNYLDSWLWCVDLSGSEYSYSYSVTGQLFLYISWDVMWSHFTWKMQQYWRFVSDVKMFWNHDAFRKVIEIILSRVNIILPISPLLRLYLW